MLTCEVRMIYVHLGFFLWLLLIPFIDIKERKMKNWKKALEKKPKDERSSHVTGKRSVSKYRNRRATKLLSVDSLFKNYFFFYNHFFCFFCFPLARLARAVCSPPHSKADFPFALHFSHRSTDLKIFFKSWSMAAPGCAQYTPKSYWMETFVAV